MHIGFLLIEISTQGTFKGCECSLVSTEHGCRASIRAPHSTSNSPSGYVQQAPRLARDQRFPIPPAGPAGRGNGTMPSRQDSVALGTSGSVESAGDEPHRTTPSSTLGDRSHGADGRDMYSNFA